MASAERFSVPLNTMCSMKCEMPFHSVSSSREPDLSQMPIETERMCDICSVITVTPFGKTRRLMLRVSFTIEFLLFSHIKPGCVGPMIFVFCLLQLRANLDFNQPKGYGSR